MNIRVGDRSKVYLRNLLLGLLTVNLLAVLWVVHTLETSRAIFEENAANATRNMVATLDQSLSASINGIDLTLLAVKDYLEEGLLKPGGLKASEVNTYFKRAQERLPYVYGIRASDASGLVSYGWDVDPKAGLTWADRDFFESLRGTPEVGLQITNPLYGKVSKRWILSFVRRYNTPDGRFAGVISASIPVEYFSGLLAKLEVGAAGVALLRDSNLGLIARHPPSPTASGQLGAKGFSPELNAAIQSGLQTVTYHSRNTADGIERTNTYRRLTSAPFHLVAGLGASDYLTPWHTVQRNLAIELAVFVLATSMAAWLLYRSHLRSQKDQRRISAVLKGASDGIHILDMQGNLILGNESFYRMLGRDANARVIRHIQDWDAGLTTEESQTLFQEIAQSGEQRLVESLHRRSDGTTFPVEVSMLPQQLEEQTVLFCASRDITARVKAEAQARDTQELMMAAINAVEEAFVIYDECDRMVYCNDRYRSMYAATVDLIVYGETFESIVRKGAERGVYLDAIGRIDEFVAARVAAHQSGNQRVISHLDDGRVMRVIDRRLPNGYIVGFRIDVTELVTATRKAEELSKSKSRFLANMSHEIRTPMNAILGMLNLLQRTGLDSRQRDYAVKAEGAGQSLLGLLNDVLDFSKVDAGKMTLECLPLQIETLMRNLSVVLSANISSKPIEVLFELDPQIPAVVMGDAMRLQQVLINLGGNAVKFTEQGQVLIALKLLASEGPAVRIGFLVQDSGIGIALENQEQIFSGFSQAEASTTRRFGGTGLGLAISKSLIELMGGTLRLDSVLGSGSTFSFQLDFPKAEEAGDSETPAPLPQLPPQKVLVVDDNHLAQDLLLGMVHSLGWQGESVGSGQAALIRLQEVLQAPGGEAAHTLILMNWQMQPMDGWETSRKLRELVRASATAQPKLLMLSDSGRQGLALRSAEEQALVDGFLMKPFTPAMLLEALADARSDSPSIRAQSAARSSKRQLAGMRILVVEDNLINQQVADELLSTEGAIVSLAANGQLGVDAVRSAAPQFDVVLMDLQMPVMDGYAATAAIRNDLGLTRLPIIAMTANAMPGDREACIAAGMNEHIGKPFDMAKLVSQLIRSTGFHAHADAWPEPDSEAPPTQEALPEMEGLDLPGALARMSGARSLYKRTAKDFLKILQSVQDELLARVQANDRDKLVMGLHTLKGNAGTLGITSLAEQAKHLETLCKGEEDLARCEQALATLAAPIEQAKALLEQAIGWLEAAAHGSGAQASTSASVPTSPPAPIADLAAVLDRLSALLQQSDMASLQTFAEHRTSLETLPGDLFDQLDAAMQDLDFAAALTVCERATAKAPS